MFSATNSLINSPIIASGSNIELVGSIIASSFSMIGGSSASFLKADGTVDNNIYALDSNVIHRSGYSTETKNGELVIDSGTPNVSGLVLNRIPSSKVLKTDSLGSVTQSTYLEDINYVKESDVSSTIVGNETNTVKVATTKAVYDAIVPQIIITSTVGINSNTTDSNGFGQNGRTVVVNNSIAITYTINSPLTTLIMKYGANITFVQGSGRNMIQVDGTNILSGVVGSTATIISVGSTDYLRISNA